MERKNMKSSFLSKAIIALVAILFLAVPVSAEWLNNTKRLNNKDKNCDFQVERSSVYHFAGSGELTSPLPADCLDDPNGCTLKGDGTISQMFVTGPSLPLAPPTWTSEVNILWANSISTIMGGLCAPVEGTITDTFPDGSTLTAKIAGLACTIAPLKEGDLPLPCTCYLTAKVVEGTGLCEGAKGIAKITSSIGVDGKITMIGEGTLKLVNKKVVE
jgi:hypothetical protein